MTCSACLGSLHWPISGKNLGVGTVSYHELLMLHELSTASDTYTGYEPKFDLQYIFMPNLCGKSKKSQGHRTKEIWSEVLRAKKSQQRLMHKVHQKPGCRYRRLRARHCSLLRLRSLIHSQARCRCKVRTIMVRTKQSYF